MSDDLEKLWQNVKTQRDELRVQGHLAKAELEDEWHDLELKWETAEKNLQHFQSQAKDVSDDWKDSARVVMEELSSAYDRIKSRLG